MEERFEIIGGNELTGEVVISGAKNAAGPLLAATILTNEKCRIGNLPKVSDVFSLVEILRFLGKEVEWVGENEIEISGEGLNFENLSLEKTSKSRISVLLMGALLAKLKNFKVPRPGGDRIGVRPIDTHLSAFRKLGAEIKAEGDFYHFKRTELKGREIILPEFSVTATENIILASVLAKGKTIIKTSAQEPHVQNLIEMLNEMGAKIKTNWANVIEIDGVDELSGVSYSLIPDSNEAGTFLIIGALAGNNLVVKNIEPSHLDIFLEKLKEIGCSFEKGNDYIKISKGENLRAAKIQALPHPGFPTDLLPLAVILLTQAEGKSLIHDPLYENRLNYIQELKKMGADIEIVDPHRAFVFGKTPLSGLTIESWDIRAGASLVVAGLIAQGKTIVRNISQIDRGYEKIEEKLRKVGAEIKRISV